jgi:hypothetical protein
MKTRHALTAAAALAAALTGCTEQDADRFADALRSASAPASAAAETSPAVDVNQTRQQLAGLTIAPEGPDAGYSREKFPHWITIHGTCNTREEALKRDGQGVQVGTDCYPTSGTWVSPYDGTTWHQASDVDTDHLVPLAEAWRSGASEWSTAQRKAFANDLQHPQLVTVTDNENSRKSDRDVAEYRPPLQSYWCAYAVNWVDVKGAYRLTADPAEVDALGQMLDTCGGGS